MGRTYEGRLRLLRVAALASLGVPAVAVAQTPAECAHAYESAQRVRLRGHLRASRAELEVCSATVCSASLRDDCVAWLAELAQAMPSVVFTVRGSHGEKVIGIQVTMDGEPLVTAPGAGAVDVDPGLHTFRFEAAGRSAASQQVTIREGEKAREVRVTLSTEAPPPPAPLVPSRASSPLLLPYVLAGSGAALAAVGSAFEIWGLSKRADVNACQPPCSLATYTSDKGAAQRTFLAGDILLGAGISALAAGTILYLVRRPLRHETVEAFGAWPVAGGWMGAAQVRF